MPCRVPVNSATLREAFANQIVATSGADPSRIAGNRIEMVNADASFGRLISASKLPAIASNDLCLGLEPSSSASPWRGSNNIFSNIMPTSALSRTALCEGEPRMKAATTATAKTNRKLRNSKNSYAGPHIAPRAAGPI